MHPASYFWAPQWLLSPVSPNTLALSSQNIPRILEAPLSQLMQKNRSQQNLKLSWTKFLPRPYRRHPHHSRHLTTHRRNFQPKLLKRSSHRIYLLVECVGPHLIRNSPLMNNVQAIRRRLCLSGRWKPF